MREEVKALKLKKDDCLEAVLYRHTWEVELQGGGKQTQTRHNLIKIIKVDQKDDAKPLLFVSVGMAEGER